MTNEIKTGAKLGTKVGEAVVYVVYKFGSFAYCTVSLYEGLTMEECVALRGNGDIESYCEKDGLEWHNVECSVDAVRGKLLDLRTKAEKTERKEAPKPAKVDRDMLRAEFAKAWKDPRMVDYCTNKVAAVAVLPTTGEIITFDKMSIETRFCFGESGYDAEDARKMAAHARTSCDYFKEENMRAFKQWLDNLEDARTLEGRYILTIGGRAYTGQADDCKLRYIRLERISKVIDDLGGSAFLADLPGQTVTENGSGRKYRIATAEELEAITNACKQAAAAHEKKVDAYLKRYGTSKVHAWTYWRDA